MHGHTGRSVWRVSTCIEYETTSVVYESKMNDITYESARQRKRGRRSKWHKTLKCSRKERVAKKSVNDKSIALSCTWLHSHLFTQDNGEGESVREKK